LFEKKARKGFGERFLISSNHFPWFAKGLFTRRRPPGGVLNCYRRVTAEKLLKKGFHKRGFNIEGG